VQGAPGAGEYLPAEHLLQLTAPSTSPSPALHSKHFSKSHCSAYGWYLPAGQGTHAMGGASADK
jgi:hypothetical protein